MMKDIQWYPGHMAKAKRQIQSDLKKVDIAFVLLDARVPFSSMNPMFMRLLQQKPTLYLLNKSDKVSDQDLAQVMQHFKTQHDHVLAISATTGKNLQKIVPYALNILKDKRERDLKKGLKPRPIRAMILGIPNTGKSTLINRLVKKKALATGDKPGVTRQLQWISMHEELLLLDTPGMLWPKFDDQDVALRLALVGTIKDTLVSLDRMVFFALDYLRKKRPSVLKSRFDLKEIPVDNLTLLEAIGTRIGALQKGGVVDYDRVMQRLLVEFRQDKFGPVMLDDLP